MSKSVELDTLDRGHGVAGYNPPNLGTAQGSLVQGECGLLRASIRNFAKGVTGHDPEASPGMIQGATRENGCPLPTPWVRTVLSSPCRVFQKQGRDLSDLNLFPALALGFGHIKVISVIMC